MTYIVDLVDSIEKLFEEKPDKRKKVEYKDWKDKLNSLIQQINKDSKFKMYDSIK